MHQTVFIQRATIQKKLRDLYEMNTEMETRKRILQILQQTSHQFQVASFDFNKASRKLLKTLSTQLLKSCFTVALIFNNVESFFQRQRTKINDLDQRLK